MPLYVPLDVDFATDAKFLAAGPLAGYLYIASLALAKRTLSDGKIDRPQLVAISIGIPTPEKQAARLVDVGLWTLLEDGWLISSWLKRNKSKAEVEKKRKQKSDAAKKANHTRWHSDEPSAECPFCDPNRIESGIQVEEEPKPEPKAEAEPRCDDVAVERETADRIRRRRSKGEDIGPTLEALIREDVIRDLAAISREDSRGKCAHCAGRFGLGTGWMHKSDCPELKSPDPDQEVSA